MGENRRRRRERERENTPVYERVFHPDTLNVPTLNREYNRVRELQTVYAVQSGSTAATAEGHV